MERTTQMGVGRFTAVKGNRLQEAHAMEGSWVRSEGHAERMPGVLE